MRETFRITPIATTAMALTVVGLIGLSTVSVYAEDKAKSLTPLLEEGKKLSFDRKKGNCLACHVISGGEQGGNIGPPLVAMKARFPDKAVLRAQIADARIKVPNTIMIPFGPHGVMSDEEIDKVLDYIYTL